MNKAPEHCHLCERFTRRIGNPPPGHGYCEGWEKFRRHDETNEACPLWKEARDQVERKRWAEQQQKETQQ